MEKTKLFQAIDLDRTLFDTAGFVAALTEEINKEHPGLGTELDAQFEAAYARGETFFLLRYLREVMGDAGFEELVRTVVKQRGAEAFALPGMRERLEFAEHFAHDGPAWGILTYGDEIDQLLKMELLGLEHSPVLLTDTPDKAQLIQSWQNTDGTFTLPEAFGGHTVHEVTLEDDKRRAFRGLPRHAVGLWLTQQGSEGHHDDDGVQVVPVADLYESMNYLKNKYQL